MDKDIFELIVKSLTNSDDKTKQVMDIVFPPKIVFDYKDYFKHCENGHFYDKNEYCCPHCKPTIDCFEKCNDGHFFQKKFKECPYCCDEKPVIKYETVNSKPVDKKQEIMDSLCYLKSKEKKTNQDKESIYTLEMILRNMK
jgi:hypothetical protein